MVKDEFSWVNTHKELTKYLSAKENSQTELIRLLKSVGIGPFNDRSKEGGHNTELDEIDPFTFFCYIYKYGAKKRLDFLQKIAKKLDLTIPKGKSGVPTSQAQKVWLFPEQYKRTNNEVKRLWEFFKRAISNTITDNDFQDILQIQNTGKTKLTEVLFYINPEKYFPINGPTKPFIKEVLGLNPKFKTYNEYIDLLEKIKAKSTLPFYELSFEARKWNSERKGVNYWVFQGNPKVFDFETALRNEIIANWTVSAHKDKIKVGDKVILWITGNKSGCYALAEVTSKPHQKTASRDDHLWKNEDKSSLKAEIKITHNLVDRPILSKLINEIDELKNLKVGNQGTNFSATEEEFKIILKMAQDENDKQYWLYAPGKSASKWEEFYNNGIMALGWDGLKDLREYPNRTAIKEDLNKEHYKKGDRKNDISANDDFVNKMNVGDIIIAKRGRKVLLGYGEVISKYYFDQERNSFKHCRKVDWKKKGEWKIDHNLVLKTLTDITRYDSEIQKGKKYYEVVMSYMEETGSDNTKQLSPKINLLKYKKQIILQGPPGTGKTREAKIMAEQLLGINKEELENSEQFKLIQFHPSYTYEDFVRGITAKPNPDGDGILYKAENKVLGEFAKKALDNLLENRVSRENTDTPNQFKAFVNHVIEKIDEGNGHLNISDNIYIFSVEEERFKYKGDNWTAHPSGLNMNFSQLKKIIDLGLDSRQKINKCEELNSLTRQHATYYHNVAEMYKKFKEEFKPPKKESELKNFVLVIDEINRANLSSVLGELIYALEYRGDPVESMYDVNDSKELILPPNLYIIGTMNTADRSIGHIDYAIRRRFAFIEMLPKELAENEEMYFNTESYKKVTQLFTDANVSPEFEAKDVQVGHSYFIVGKDDVGNGQSLQKLFDLKMEYEVIPILREYVRDGVLKGEIEGKDVEDYIEDLKPNAKLN